jgi:hypothetical protein
MPACSNRIAAVFTQHVHGDGFLAPRWTGSGGDLHVFGKVVFESVTTKSLSNLGGEERLGRLAGAASQTRRTPTMLGAVPGGAIVP